MVKEVEDMYKNIILNDSSNFTISGMRDVVDIVREKMGADMAEIVKQITEDYYIGVEERKELNEKAKKTFRENEIIRFEITPLKLIALIEQLKKEGGGGFIVTDKGNVSVIYGDYTESDVRVSYAIEACMGKEISQGYDKIKLIIKNEKGKENIRNLMKDVVKYASIYPSIYDYEMPVIKRDLLEKYRDNLLIGYQIDDIEITNDVINNVIEFADFIEMPLSARELYYGIEWENSYAELLKKVFLLCEEKGKLLINFETFREYEKNVVKEFLNNNLDISKKYMYGLKHRKRIGECYYERYGEKLINKITITNPLKLFNEIK